MTPTPTPSDALFHVDDLAQFIRTVDGNHAMGAGELAERICDWMTPYSRRTPPASEQPSAPEPVAWKRYIEVNTNDGSFWTARTRKRELMCGPFYDLGMARRMLAAETADAANSAPPAPRESDQFTASLAAAREHAPTGQGGESNDYIRGWRDVLEYIAMRYSGDLPATAPREAAQEPIAWVPRYKADAPQRCDFSPGDFDWMSVQEGAENPFDMDSSWEDVPLYTHPVPQQRESAPSMADVLRCPFCGSSDISDGEVLGEDRGGLNFKQSECQGCGALGPKAPLLTGEMDFGDVKAIAAWNRRSEPAPLRPVTYEDVMEAVSVWKDTNGGLEEVMRAVLENDRKRLAGEGA